MADLCHRCQKREIAKGRRKYCDPCAEIVADETLKRTNATAIAKEKARRAANPTLAPCQCGCGQMVRHPRKWAVECRAANEKAIQAGIREREKIRRRAATVARKAERAAERARLAAEAVSDSNPTSALADTIKEANGLRERRAALNPELLAARLFKGAIPI